jgi:hypothetical protein
MDTRTETALNAFVAAAQNTVNEHFATHFPTLQPSRLSIEPGKRYVRIVTTRTNSDGTPDTMSRSVYCFVDTTNGDILKADSWKKPAKHSRGSIFAQDHGQSAVNWHGAHYLR